MTRRLADLAARGRAAVAPGDTPAEEQEKARDARSETGSDTGGGVRGHLELRLWLRLLGCTVRIESILQRRLRKEFGISLARFDMMAQLERFPGGLTMSELSRRLTVSNGAITGLVDKMLSEGLVQRHGDPEDRRAVIVRLTEKGRAMFLQMARRHEEWVVLILGELTEAAQSELLQNLTLLKRNLDLQFGA